MLFVFHGSDTKKVADQTSKFVKGLLKKREGAQLFIFEGEQLVVEEVDALIEARGLFVEKHIVVLKQPTAHPEGKEVVFNRLKRFSETENIFVIAEGKLLVPDKKKLEKYAKQVEEHTQKENKKDVFNVFSLGDALGQRSRQELWVGYVQAQRAGLDVESIHGTLHWAVRCMLIASRTGSPQEAGLNSFVYSKNKRYAQNFTQEELRALSRDLISISHDARRGKHDFSTALEHWMLTL